jgi:hypothetical protein
MTRWPLAFLALLCQPVLAQQQSVPGIPFASAPETAR